jgi:hypothetical protein
VLEVGPQWVLGMRVEDGGYLDGYVAFRLKDVTSVKKDKTFAATTARILPGWPPRPPVYPMDLASAATVLDGFGNNAAIVGIETQGRRRGLWVGQIDAIDRKRVWLRELDIKGDWLDQMLGYKLRDITSVSENGRYLRAIAMVASAREDRETASEGEQQTSSPENDPATGAVANSDEDTGPSGNEQPPSV